MPVHWPRNSPSAVKIWMRFVRPVGDVELAVGVERDAVR